MLEDSHRKRRSQEFLKQASEKFPKVIMICGNHEYYHTEMLRAMKILRKEVAQYENFHLLDDEELIIDDTVFIGSTMWTDMNGHNPLAEIECNKWMMDFSVIQYRDQRYNAAKSAKMFDKSVGFIENRLREHRDKQCVVITHHAPSRHSSSPVFFNSPINPAFYSDLDNYIQDQPNVPIWIHGHMHNSSDYKIGKTRILCNPRGHIGDAVEGQRAMEFELKHFELEVVDNDTETS
jgi:predicted phosphodiesterase